MIKRDRHEATSFEGLEQGNRVVVFIVSVLQLICEILIPKDSDGFIRAVGKHVLQTKGDSSFKESLMVAYEALPERSMQKSSFV